MDSDTASDDEVRSKPSVQLHDSPTATTVPIVSNICQPEENDAANTSGHDLGGPHPQRLRLIDLPLEDAIREKIERSKKLNIVMVGQFGSGKSTLINAMLNMREAAEGHDMTPCTKEVKGYEYKIEGTDVTVTVYDSRGQQDDEDDKKYLKQLKKKCKKIHLIIYCTVLADPVYQEEINAIETICSVFGKEILDNVVVALTKANQVKRGKVMFNHIVIKKKEELKKMFDSLKRKHSTYFEGFGNRTYSVGCEAEQYLPNNEDWLPEFWKGCLSACKEEAKGAIIKLLLWLYERFKSIIKFIKKECEKICKEDKYVPEVVHGAMPYNTYL